MLAVAEAVARTRFGISNAEALRYFDRRLRALSKANRVLAHGHVGSDRFCATVITLSKL